MDNQSAPPRRHREPSSRSPLAATAIRHPWLRGLTAPLLVVAACDGGPIGNDDERRYRPTPPTVLSSEGPGVDEDPSILRAHDGSLLIAWSSDRSGEGDIYVTRVEEGSSWGVPTRVTTSGAGDFAPSLIQDSEGTFHVAWYRWTSPFRGNIYYNRSTDGVTWDPEGEVRVTFGRSAGDWMPSLIEGPDGALLIYFASSNRTPSLPISELYITRQDPSDGGWSPPELLHEINGTDQHDNLPFAMLMGEQIGIVWVRHDTDGPLPWESAGANVFQSTSSDGVTWSPPVQVTHEDDGVLNLFPTLYRAGAWRLAWLSISDGSAAVYDMASSAVDSYPAGVFQLEEVGSGYSHRIVETATPNVYLGVWVDGAGGERDIVFRFFER